MPKADTETNTTVPIRGEFDCAIHAVEKQITSLFSAAQVMEEHMENNVELSDAGRWLIDSIIRHANDADVAMDKLKGVIARIPFAPVQP
jgi:hypothetical protein